MNIAFLLKSLDMGGVNVVSSVLANKFLDDGHKVCCFAFYKGIGSAYERFNKKIPFIIGNGFEYNNGNSTLFRNLLIRYQIDVVINQWGMPLVPIKTFYNATKGLTNKIKIISVYHNDPLQNGRIQNVKNDILITSNYFKIKFLKLKKNIFRYITGKAMRFVYNHSDVYEVLSHSYVENFKKFTGLRTTPKIVVQTNPVTIDNKGFVYNKKNKQREIIYIGRLDNTQKCVHRIIDAWSKIEKKYSDWRLTIVGDGKDRNYLEQQTKNGLSRVFFEGIQQPRPYYERASILLLTSDFEGFPLVLAEAMQFGVVPIVYESFKAVHDIIDDGVNGFITPSPYNLDDTVDRLHRVMDNDKLREQMAIAAIEKSNFFSIDRIASQWYSLMNALNNK